MSISTAHAAFLESIERNREIYMRALSSCDACEPRCFQYIVPQVFLNLTCDWENYVEEVLLQYLLGETSCAGNRYVTHVVARDRHHASRILQGISAQYVDWLNFDQVQRILEAHFCNVDTRLLDGFLSFRPRLKEIKTVRNAIAHKSCTAREKYNDLIRGKLPNSVGISVADFLTSRKPGDSCSFYSYYEEAFNGSADFFSERDVSDFDTTS